MDKIRQGLLQILIEKLGQAIKNMHSGHNFPFGDLQLSRQQAMILFFISKNPDGVSVKALAKSLCVTPGAITQFVDSLVVNKLVERRENTDDRRQLKIRLTPSAAKKFNQFQRAYFVAASYAFDDFSAADLKKFIGLINKIKKV